MLYFIAMTTINAQTNDCTRQLDGPPDALSREVADAWLTALSAADPLLVTDPVRETITEAARDLVDLLDREPFDPAPAQAVGARFEGLDGLQSRDLQEIQTAAFRALAAGMATEDQGERQARIGSLLFALGCGFFVTKAQHASRFNVSAMSRMGHDLKTPINAITGFSRVILKGIDGPITDFQREDLTSIYEAGQKLLTMINDLFAVRKRDAARTLLLEPPFEVVELLTDIVRTVQPLAAERDHTVELQLVGDLGTMSLDASMVRWVLLSLLGHAIRQANGGLIRVSASRDTVDEGWLLFEVTSVLPEGLRVYAETPRSEGDDGAGWPDEIGLTTCRRFCESMGGSVARTKTDALTFTVRLPAALRVSG